MYSKIKEPSIDLMVKSGIILRECLLLAESMVKPGITTNEINNEVHKYILDRNAVPAFLGYSGFPAACCMSINEEVVHCLPSDRPLVGGDILTIDCGVIKDGAYTDAARTFPVGKISAGDKELLKITREALDRGTEKAVAGNRIGLISNTIQAVVELAGYSVSREFIGHGIGSALHMLPDIPNYGSKRTGSKLSIGEFIAIEPVVFDGGWKTTSLGEWKVVSSTGVRSAHFENTIYISEFGPVILTE